MFDQLWDKVKSSASQVADFELHGGCAGWLGEKTGTGLKEMYDEVAQHCKDHPGRAAAEAVLSPVILVADSAYEAHQKK